MCIRDRVSTQSTGKVLFYARTSKMMLARRQKVLNQTLSSHSSRARIPSPAVIFTSRSFKHAPQKSLLFQRPSSALSTTTGTLPSAVWNFRFFHYTSIGLGVAIPVAILIGGTPFLDVPIGLVVPLHAHKGLNKVIQDYCPRVFNLKEVAFKLNYVLTAVAIAALLHLNIYDVGITEAFRSLWK
eukprot:TRINITY_DN221_c0_g1_i1.p1 TRINITY_DN221_c0_g1~~TRINITY_DN221_c0_g1_i1.p1  ORF type:complete len:184 (-),score=33.40 TRINITY_DN221_c0_g1_i1:101-652(-)